MIAEYDNGAAVASPSREYIYSGAQLLATVTGSGPTATTTYHHADHLTVRVTTDGTTSSPTFGQVIGQQGHFPFGESWYQVNTTTKWLFTSYERDGESGLDYAMARYYDSRVARFCSADPVEGWPADPQSWNRYAYVRNDPINLTDPSGQFWHFLAKLFRWLFKAFVKLLFKSHNIHLGNVSVRTPPFFAVGASFGFQQLLPGGGKVTGTPPFFASGTAYYGGLQADQEWAQAVGECANKKFGVTLLSFTASRRGSNGQFVGIGVDAIKGDRNVKITVTNDVRRYSMRELTLKRYGVTSLFKAPTVTGATFPNDPYTNYSANDLPGRIDFLQNQVHELGHSFNQITGTGLAERGVSESDPGAMFEDCFNATLARIHGSR